MSKLADALFTTTQQKVLGLLYTRPEKSFYTKEIIRSTGMGVATIKRELDRMLAAGIVSMTKVGNQHHYRANPRCPIYDELLGIARKTFGVADVIRHALEPFDEFIELAFIYGSIAKGTDSESSDIDLMLVGKKLHYGDVMERLIPLEGSLQRTVNPTIYDPVDFIAKLNEGNSFLSRVMQQSIIIIKGVIDDFREPGKDKSA